MYSMQYRRNIVLFVASITSKYTGLRCISHSRIKMNSIDTTIIQSHQVFLALGSNQGDRSRAIYQALQELKSIGNIKATSYLYETAPMYVKSQSTFLNAACLIETLLNPLELLDALKTIEKQVGRTSSFRNGPRLIDLDILFYDHEIFSNERLILPHPRVCERVFVLKPLCDIAPTFVHPSFPNNTTLSDLYSLLPLSERKEVKRVMPVYNHLYNITRMIHFPEEHSTDFPSSPLIMGILNLTPDSFSDGGQFNQNIDSSIQQVISMLAAGANIIDIGGESTRPGSQTILIEEEINRVIPVIKAIRERGIDCMISVDTRKAKVAYEAIQVGADLVNDVSAGYYDPDMIHTVGNLGVAYIAMHMRGEPNTMQNSEYLQYSSDDNQLIIEIANELNKQLIKINCHIPKWLQIVDPGIGFAKGYKENMQLLQPKNLKHFRELLDNRPILVGLSRKKFLSKLINDSIIKRKAMNGIKVEDNIQTTNIVSNLESRDLGTAGGCICAILGGTDILRVHNVEYTRTVCDTFTNIINPVSNDNV